uniref:Uncharacterized protein n=1 Tax=Paenibacillus athensensis TaxID=1967502 RepID=A0A4Y8Q4Q3_9BACL
MHAGDASLLSRQRIFRTARDSRSACWPRVRASWFARRCASSATNPSRPADSRLLPASATCAARLVAAQPRARRPYAYAAADAAAAATAAGARAKKPASPDAGFSFAAGADKHPPAPAAPNPAACGSAGQLPGRAAE